MLWGKFCRDACCKNLHLLHIKIYFFSFSSSYSSSSYFFFLFSFFFFFFFFFFFGFLKLTLLGHSVTTQVPEPEIRHPLKNQIYDNVLPGHAYRTRQETVIHEHGTLMVTNMEKPTEPGEKPAPMPLHSPQWDIHGIKPEASEWEASV
jgi:hypothetical protein